MTPHPVLKLALADRGGWDELQRIPLPLVVPSVPLAVGVSMVALALSVGITCHGVPSLCRENEDVAAASVAHGVVAVGLMAWALLPMLIVPV
jgi:hypothetical protein